jgi:hypothetical protein
MIIKKHKNRNEYVLTSDGIWVRNFCKQDVSSIDVNSFLNEEEYHCILNNEFENNKLNFNQSYQTIQFPNIIIVSDGYDFINKQKILSKLPYKEVAIFAVNGALRDWKLVGKNCTNDMKRSIDWFIVNNPYPECKKFLPKNHSYYPRCLASSRTNSEFIKQYQGDVVLYQPSSDENYSGVFYGIEKSIDDYRNPICAAISLAYRFGVKKLGLFCCDNSFIDERPSAEKLDNGLWCYPQHKISQRVIDANLYWLSQNNIKIFDCSSGEKYEHASYISIDEISIFFKDDK